MRELFKIFVVGIIIFLSPCAMAEEYKLLILPDNAVTQNVALDSYIYNDTAEFFTDEIITLLNGTTYIKCRPLSQTRTALNKNIYVRNSAKELLNRFRTTYNIDYNALKRVATATGDRYILLITSSVDAENYILRRTWWDFFNIPGASVIDPAYKISTYAVLVDTANNRKLWADTYYKTISVCENRIITRGQSPQTEQLGKIKDYSVYVCPQIAQNVQLNLLPSEILAKENTKIEYDMGNIDNVFTKKYRHLKVEADKIKEENRETFNAKKQQWQENKQKRAELKAEKLKEKAEKEAETKLEVKAVPYSEDLIKINTVKVEQKEAPAVYNTDSNIEPVEINKRSIINNLYGDNIRNKPTLRGYN
ncbi:MAG: hypothetical protein MJ237_06895 [bacterium]|nr:hypothetical protein [bacterium]